MPVAFKYTVPGFCKDEGRCVVDVWAMKTDTPGVLLTEADPNLGAYRLTHECSGIAITSRRCSATRDVFGLLQFAKDVAECGDWTRSAFAISNDTALAAKINRAFDGSALDWIPANPSPEHAAASRNAIASGSN